MKAIEEFISIRILCAYTWVDPWLRSKVFDNPEADRRANITEKNEDVIKGDVSNRYTSKW